MKKVGSSRSTSKTRSSSKSSAKPPKRKRASPEIEPASDPFSFDPSAFAGIAVGHQPSHELKPQDEALFRAFQSNLLSLISHELRTPLMGVLNALNLLDESRGAPEEVGLSQAELVSMARRNAQRLQQTLSSLLDLASLESGTFHARLREVDLEKLVEGRVQLIEPSFRDQGLTLSFEKERGPNGAKPLLGDPQKLSRAVDLCLQNIHARGQTGTTAKVRISSSAVELTFALAPQSRELWISSWSQALAGVQSGVHSPGSVFSGTVQTEEAFLTRMEEGLGSEFVLIHEIMRLHRGSFDRRMELDGVTLVLKFPELDSEEGIRVVLSSRIAAVSPEQGGLGSVALSLLQGEAGQDLESFRREVKKCLFRASDSVYSLPSRNLLALVLDDCRPEDAPLLLNRIQKTLGRTFGYGIAVCPTDGLDPGELIGTAERRLEGRKPS